MLLGVSGYARSGKDTIADYLVRQHGFRRIAFADIMRNMLLAIDPIVFTDLGIEGGGLNVVETRVSHLINLFGWDEAKTRYLEIRRLLQTLGTDAGRRYLGENIWVDAALRGVHRDEDVVFSDCRFTNETAAIKDRGGFIWRVTRPGVDAVNAHPSERGLDGWNFDRLIKNDASIGQLELRVDDSLILTRTLVNA